MFWIKIHRKFAFQTKNVIFSEKHYFHEKMPFFTKKRCFLAFFLEKKGNFSKKMASWRAPKETKKQKRRRMQFDDPNAFLGLFFALPTVFSLNLRAFSFQFHKNFDSNFRAFLLHFGQHNSLLSRLQYLIYSFVPNTMAFCSVFIVSFVSISYSVFFRRKSIFRGVQGGGPGPAVFPSRFT